MNLAPCRACGLEISTQATACPKCGQPLPTVSPDQIARTRIAAGVKLFLIVLGGVGAVWYACNDFNEYRHRTEVRP